jgi:hypothetical protein
MRDDWRSRLETRLLSAKMGSAARRTPEPGQMLDVAFGRIRSELSYVLDFGRAHGVPVHGKVDGDDLQLAIGGTQLRFRLDRRAHTIETHVPGRANVPLKWSAQERGIVGPKGERVDVELFVREGIDVVVSEWHAAGEDATGGALGDSEAEFSELRSGELLRG